MTSPVGPSPDYMAQVIEHLVDHLGAQQYAAVISRLDKIMADQTAFAEQLSALDATVGGLSDLVNQLAAGSTPDPAALDAARADGEQSGFDQATALLAQHVTDAQTVLANLQAANPAPAAPAAAFEDTPIFNTVLGQPGA